MRVNFNRDRHILPQRYAALLGVFLGTFQSTAVNYYVNDAGTAGDVFCTAPGLSSHDGLSSNTPLASIQAVLDLEPAPSSGDTVYIDAGTYVLQDDLELPHIRPGNTSCVLRVMGAGRRTVLERVPALSGSCCLRIKQDFTHIQGLTFRGAGTGVVIDPSTCRNATLVHNSFLANSGYGIVVLPDQMNQGIDTYTIQNNLLYGNGGGMNLQADDGYHRGRFIVVNNTVAVYNGTGIACGGGYKDTTLLNNIVAVKGSGFCLALSVADSICRSDYNNFYVYGGAKVALGSVTDSTLASPALSDWQKAGGCDTFSISSNPLFISPDSGDYHLCSQAGAYHNGADGNGVWMSDMATSPSIDAGDPASCFGGEPVPNGGRVNQGAFGNTPEASKSVPGRSLTLLSPQGGGTWSGTLSIVWSISGDGWGSNDTVRIEYATETAGVLSAWTNLPNASGLAIRTNVFEWQTPTDATARYFLRVVCNQDPSVYDITSSAGIVNRQAVSYYVNDTLLTGDMFCTAPGASANTGKTPDTPVASLKEILDRYTLNPGDTVYVDAGTYYLSNNILIAATHKGSPDMPIRIIGTRGNTHLIRTAGGIDRYCLYVHADFIRIEGLACESADIGIRVNASLARHASLIANSCNNNAVYGIKVEPEGVSGGESYQILQNVIVKNGAGLFLKGSMNEQQSRTQFIVENNTLFNTGPGVFLRNANTEKRRTNVLKNNIIGTTNAQSACVVALPRSIHYSDFNNLYALNGSSVGAWETGASEPVKVPSLALWREATSGQDAHSFTNAPVFVNAMSGNFRLKPDSPCVDSGIISYWMSGTSDADGNLRVSGPTADLGAYELYVRTSIRVLLQGPFVGAGAEMSSALSTSGMLPYQSPYAAAPRVATRIPSNVTDWVLVQFRQSPDTPAVLSHSAFLRNDGWIVDDKGLTDLGISLPRTNAFYVVIKHRNHLAAMSAVPVAFNNQLMAYDFTAGANKYFGGSSSCTPVYGTNVLYALRAGDTDGDGTVGDADLAICDTLAGTTGVYRRSDMNLDGSITSALDGEMIQNGLLEAASSPVPHPETILYPALRITPSRKTVFPDESVTLANLASSAASTTFSTTNGVVALDVTSATLNWDFARNGSGAPSLNVAADGQALYTAGPVTGSTDVVEAWDSKESIGRAFLNVVSTQATAIAGQALVIAGRSSASDTLWPATDYLADTAYTTLRYRGFSKENIHYLSPEPEQDVDNDGNYDDIDAQSTHVNAALAFTNGVSGASDLFVYLVDHGGNSSGNGYFRLSATETITAVELDAWLDALQDTYHTKVTVLLDFCYAGSFLSALTYTNTASRIVVAACDTNQPSYFVAGGLVSFSSAFFSGVMLGYDVMECFEMAQNAMSTYQAALLDDDKDGLYTTNDWERAANTFIGPSYIAAGEAPQIGEVCGNQVLSDETAATVWIGSVSSLHPVSRAWCLIIPPGHDPDPDNPVIDLPQLDLAYDDSTGRYTVTYDGFTAPGTYIVTFYVQDEEGNVSVPRTSYIAQIGYDDRVILVAGGDTNSPAWPSIRYLTHLAYDTLRLRLFTPEHIQILSPETDQDFDGDGTNDVAAASLANLYGAIAEWASTNSTDRLTLYLIGEGTGDALCLNGTECLATNQLAAWVHDFQTTNPVPVNIVLDFSGAGSFLPALADAQLAEDFPDATRICIASAHAGREALFANGGTVSFSQYLLSGVIAGKTFGEAYTDARRAIRRISGSVRQRAQIDDNLNGEPNEKDTDGSLADETYLGSAFVTGADAPVVGLVISPTVLEIPGAPVTLWASEIASMYPISNVWCVVTPPGTGETSELPVINLFLNTNSVRYESSSPCTGFTRPGVYGLTFYAEDVAGQLSAPRQSEVILADAFEPDDTGSQASVYDGDLQTHTFHTAGDEDWVRVFLVTNFIYDIETYHLSETLDTVIDIYREAADGTLEQIDHVDEEGSDEGEYTGVDYPPSGWYWLRVLPYSGGTNTVGAYELCVDVPAAAGTGSLIVLGVDDVNTSALPTGSYAFVSGQTNYFNGAKNITFPGLAYGTYRVEVPVPDNHIAREDPNVPNQVQSLTNMYYANPRDVVISGSWRMAGFEVLSAVCVTSGVVRDAWTRAYLGNAQVAFRAASGSLTGTAVDGSVILTSYRTPWTTSSNGLLPTNIVLGACNWDLSVALTGYQTNVWGGAVSNAPAGSALELGTLFLVPVDTNANAIADAWESMYFPAGGVVATDDPDGDGHNNLQEYLSGTDPTNSLSVLRFLEVSSGTGGISMVWGVVGGRSYRVVATTGLVGAVWSSTNGPWEAAHGQDTMQWADTNTLLHAARFYRIGLNTP